MNLFGIPIITSRHAVTCETQTVHGVYADWMQRQARNFSRPSTGKWEPLEGDWEITVEKPAIFMIRDGVGRESALVHPELYNGAIRDFAEHVRKETDRVFVSGACSP